MVLILLTGISLFLVAAVVLLVVLLIRSGRPIPLDLAPISEALGRSEAALRDEAAKSRQESSTAAKETRQELSANLRASMEPIAVALADSRKELSDTLRGFSDTMHKQLGSTADTATNQFEAFSKRILDLTTSNDTRMEAIRLAVETRLQTIQDENGKKLEEMRRTVDEKLHATLEKRLGESFLAVSTQLESVHKGLGEMKALGTGVGDLKRVLTGVKTRGIFGEVLLGSLLEQVLAPEQYEKNACVREGSAERVDYAIKLPELYLPIDSKFPMEDYQRLQDAYEQADLSQIEQQLKQLETRIKLEGKSIFSKYVNPPTTTDFAILFLPNEGLFAEVIRMHGLQDWLMRECKIIVCGPTYLHGLLNSLSMGFRTLAIEKKSTEVWNTLGVVKTQFGAFADLLENVKAKLIQSTNKIDQAATKARTIERKLRKVEALPASDVDAPEDFPLQLLSRPDPETEDQEAA